MKSVMVKMLSLSLITLIALGTLNILPVSAHSYPTRFYPGTGKGEATIYVAPEDNNFTSAKPLDLKAGTKFTINVRIKNATFIASWQVELTYNKNYLSTNTGNISYASDHIFPSGSFSPQLAAVDTFNGTHNYALLMAATYYGVEYNTTDAGLMTINFTIIADPNPGQVLWCMLRLMQSSDRPPHTPVTTGTWTMDETAFNENDLYLRDGYYENRFAGPPPPPAALYVDPPKKIDPTLVACTNFTIDVNIENATALRQCALKLTFDPTILNVANATLGSFLPLTTIYTIEINNTEGHLRFSATVHSSEPALNGNGTLVEITFHVESLGMCNLTLTETSLIDDYGVPIPHSSKDGYFNNVMMAKIAVQPPEIRDPSLVPPQTFEINITIAEVEDLYGYEFKLRYNPAILVTLQVTIHDVFGEVYYTPSYSIDNTRGIVWVNVTYFEPANPISTIPPVTIVTIKFRVRGVGITTLDLYDTSLVDSSGQPIAHEAYDGLFASAKRDVALIDVVVDENDVYQGWIVKINVTVMNKGDIQDTFEVKLYYGTNSSIGTLTFVNVNPNDTVTQTFLWSTKNVQACQNYTISAEAVPLPYESELGDNYLTGGWVKIWYMGDINHDGWVDGKDIALASRAFGAYPEHPRWDPAADLNRDNRIDGKDIAKLAVNFGKRC